MALNTTSRSRRNRAISPITRLGLEANLELRDSEVIDLCSDTDRAPKRNEWDTSSESGTEAERPRKSPRENTATSSAKSSTLLAELKGLQDTAEFRSAPGSSFTTPRARRSSKRKRCTDSAFEDDASEDELHRTVNSNPSTTRATRSAKKRVSSSKNSSHTPKASRAETPPIPQTRTRRTPRNAAVTTPTNARQLQTLSSPEAVNGYSPSGNASLSSHPQLSIELDRQVIVDEARPYCADIGRRASIIRRTFVSPSLAEPEDDTDVEAIENMPNTTMRHDMQLKACGYLASASQGNTIQELLTLLAQLQTPPSIHIMLASSGDASCNTTKARRGSGVPATPSLDEILGYITRRLLQNLSIVTPDSSRHRLQSLCTSKRRAERDRNGLELLSFLVDCDAVVRMMLLR